MQSIGLIWNPSKVARQELEDALPDLANVRLSWFETSVDDPGSGAARAALDAGADLLVVAGGDGTVRAVAEHLARVGPAAPMGIVPLGTGNLLARNLGIPIGDLGAALERALADGPAESIDVGWIETEIGGRPTRRAFVVMAGVGIDAHMITETDEDLKEQAGWLAYVESLGCAFQASELLTLTIALDDAAPVERAGHTLLIGNCGSVQGGVTVFPDADPRDGRLDLLVLSADGIGQWLDTARSFLWDNGVRKLFTREAHTTDADSVVHRSARAISVSLSEPRVLEIDGEDVGDVRAFTVQVQPAAVRIR